MRPKQMNTNSYLAYAVVMMNEAVKRKVDVDGEKSLSIFPTLFFPVAEQ